MTWTIERDHLARAERAVRAHLSPTRLIEAPELGAGVHLKLENEQETGSFKIRGALAALVNLGDRAEVVTASAGNHGYGLARAGALAGVRVRVFVARRTPRVKREGIVRAGALLELVDAPGFDEVDAAARFYASQHGLRFVSAFDDPYVAAGNGGTLAREILDQLPAVRTIVAPVGGGGLVAGIGAVREVLGARFERVGVQSEACPAMARSFARGAAIETYAGAPTLAEGLEGGVSPSTFAHARAHLARMELVSESEIADAMSFARDRLGLRIEGSAAVAIAWLRREEAPAPIVAIVSGGNVD